MNCRIIHGICTVFIQKKDSFFGIGIAILFIAVAAAIMSGCSTPYGIRKEFIIGGQKVTYVLQQCSPTIKWDGMNLVLEGLQVPDKGDLSFSIGKIDYSEKAIREIRSSVFYFDGLLNATCQTIIRLDSQEAVERYSKHRDELLSILAQTLSQMEKSTSESSALQVAKKGESEASQQDSKFKKGGN